MALTSLLQAFEQMSVFAAKAFQFIFVRNHIIRCRGLMHQIYGLMEGPKLLAFDPVDEGRRREEVALLFAAR